MAATTTAIQKGINRQAQKVLRGKKPMKFDQIRQRHFWSCYFFQPDANGYLLSGRYTLFTTPVGSNGQGFPSGYVITERESNWKSQNRIPDNQNFQIGELGCGVMSAGFAIAASPLTAPLKAPPPGGLANLFQGAILNITYLTNSVPLGLLADYAQSSAPMMGIHNASATSAVYNTVAVNGWAAPALRRKLKIPILLQAGESFNFTIDLPRPMYVGYGDSTSSPFLLRVDFFATESFAEKS